jgi:hypothetical protein
MLDASDEPASGELEGPDATEDFEGKTFAKRHRQKADGEKERLPYLRHVGDYIEPAEGDILSGTHVIYALYLPTPHQSPKILRLFPSINLSRVLPTDSIGCSLSTSCLRFVFSV